MSTYKLNPITKLYASPTSRVAFQKHSQWEKTIYSSTNINEEKVLINSFSIRKIIKNNVDEITKASKPQIIITTIADALNKYIFEDYRTYQEAVSAFRENQDEIVSEIQKYLQEQLKLPKNIFDDRGPNSYEKELNELLEKKKNELIEEEYFQKENKLVKKKINLFNKNSRYNNVIKKLLPNSITYDTTLVAFAMIDMNSQAKYNVLAALYNENGILSPQRVKIENIDKLLQQLKKFEIPFKII